MDWSRSRSTIRNPLNVPYSYNVKGARHDGSGLVQKSASPSLVSGAIRAGPPRGSRCPTPPRDTTFSRSTRQQVVPDPLNSHVSLLEPSRLQSVFVKIRHPRPNAGSSEPVCLQAPREEGANGPSQELARPPIVATVIKTRRTDHRHVPVARSFGISNLIILPSAHQPPSDIFGATHRTAPPSTAAHAAAGDGRPVPSPAYDSCGANFLFLHPLAPRRCGQLVTRREILLEAHGRQAHRLWYMSHRSVKSYGRPESRTTMRCRLRETTSVIVAVQQPPRLSVMLIGAGRGSSASAATPVRRAPRPSRPRACRVSSRRGVVSSAPRCRPAVHGRVLPR